MSINFWGGKKVEEEKTAPQVIVENETSPEVKTVLVEGKPVVIDDEFEEKTRVPNGEAAPVEEVVPVKESFPVEDAAAQENTALMEDSVTPEEKLPVEEKSPVGEEKAAPTVDVSALLSTLHALSQKIDIIQRSNEMRQRELMAQQQELAARLEEKEDIIKQQHNQLLKYQDDVIYKTQHGLIMELIGLADNVRTILTKQKEQHDYEDLLDDVVRLGQWIDSSLEENGVRKFEEAATLEFNPKRQSIIETQPAPTPELSGTYVTDQPGYEWSIPYVVVRNDVQLKNFMAENKVPKKFSYVIRQEEVIKLK